jgi:hypothetical protein
MATHTSHRPEDVMTEESVPEITDPRLTRQQAHALTLALRATRAAQDPGIEGVTWEATPFGLVMLSSSDFEHAGIVSGLRDQLRPSLPTDWWVLEGVEFIVGGGYGRTPDLVVIDPAERDEFRGGHAVGVGGVKLFVEVTSSSTRRIDLEEKVYEYAVAGVPVYLIVDRKTHEIVVYAEPRGGLWRHAPGPVPIGGTIKLPDPVGVTVDTAYMLEHL